MLSARCSVLGASGWVRVRAGMGPGLVYSHVKTAATRTASGVRGASRRDRAWGAWVCVL